MPANQELQSLIFLFIFKTKFTYWVCPCHYIITPFFSFISLFCFLLLINRARVLDIIPFTSLQWWNSRQMQSPHWIKLSIRISFVQKVLTGHMLQFYLVNELSNVSTRFICVWFLSGKVFAKILVEKHHERYFLRKNDRVCNFDWGLEVILGISTASLNLTVLVG